MNPLLVALVRKHPELFKDNTTSLKVEEVPVNVIEAGAIEFDEYDGAETVYFNWKDVALWKKSHEQPNMFASLEEATFATLEAANIGDAPKAELMRLFEEFKKTIPEPMPSKPVPDELPDSDSEDEE